MKIQHSKISKFVPKNSLGRRLVIPDIHGCLETFEALLSKIQLTENDQLFLLGDYINKGKYSKEVLNLIINLQEKQSKKGCQIFPLRGNHEQMMLDNYEDEKEITEFKDSHYNFVSSLPHFYELDNFLLVHAGFTIENENPFSDTETMLWVRDFFIDDIIKTTLFGNKTIIFGHNPIFLSDILADIKRKVPSICLDNGCVYKHKWFLGNLLCLDLDSYEILIQENIES